jgi:dTMP kinase
MSRLISFEGGDGAGKTTQAALLVERLRFAGKDAVLVREPGGTPLGERLRPLIKGEAPASPMAELLMFEAARAELVQEVIQPALDAGTIVVTDRFYDSTIAYQGFGRGMDMEIIKNLNLIATGGLKPHITLLLDIEPADALARVGAQPGSRSGGRPVGRIDPAGQQKFEEQPPEFHERVAEGYRTLASEEPSRWFVIDASRPVEQIAERVWNVVGNVLKI